VSKCKLWNPLGIFSNIDSSRLHFGYKWFMHFECASGFSRLCHTFFGWRFILICGAYWWLSYLGKITSWFGHFVFMCHSSTFLSHLDNISFILPIFFYEFRQNNYVNIWGHHGSMVMGVHLGFFNKVSNQTPNLFWWYRPFYLWRIVWPICFSKELCFGGFVFVFKVSYFL